MGSVDDLIALKDRAVDACQAVVNNWESGDLAAAARECQAVVDQQEADDVAEEREFAGENNE